MKNFIARKWDKLNDRLQADYSYFLTREKRVSKGDDYPDKLFYLIRIDYRQEGLFAILKSVMAHIVYALNKNYIPVIDLENCISQYNELFPEKNSNFWELFWRQPAGFHPDQLIHAKHLIYSKNTVNPDRKISLTVDLLDDQTLLKYYRNIYQQSILLTDSVKEYFGQRLKNIGFNPESTLGVLCRGTDYLYGKPRFHSIQPEPDLVLQKAKSILAANSSIQSVFLATEDQGILDLFQKSFGDRLIYLKQDRYNYATGNNNSQRLAELNGYGSQKYQNTLTYLNAIYALSCCRCFIGGRTSGTFGVYMMTNGFECDYTWNLGRYPG